MLKILYIQKMLAVINVELELLNLRIQNPKPFSSYISSTFESDLYVTPKSKDLGIIGIAEIVIALFLFEGIIGKDGKPVPLIRLAHGFEQLFNINFGSIYDKVSEIFTRKPYKLTKTLDTLRNTIIKEDRKRRNQ